MRFTGFLPILTLIFGMMCLPVSAMQTQKVTIPDKPSADTWSHGKIPLDQEELDCLAKNVLYESGGESLRGQRAVAHVTLNRVNDDRYPDSVCSVIQQSRLVGKRRVCQFGWWCAGRGRVTPEGVRWQIVRQVAYEAMTGQSDDPTNGALNFQIKRYQKRLPGHVRARATVIGNHVFFTD